MKPNMTLEALQDLIQKNMEGFWNQTATTKHLYIQSNPEYTSTISKIPDALFNSVLSAKFSADNINSKVATVKSSYNQKGLSFCWWVSPNSTPSSLEEQLIENKFELFGEVHGMALDMSTADLSMKLPEGVSLITVETASDFADWIKPLAVSFHMSENGANSYRQIFEDLSAISKNTRHYVAFMNSAPVASSSVFLDTDSKTVGIYNCATIPEARNNGIVTALTRYSLFSAYKDGYQTATLQASPMSQKLFEEIAFESCTTYKVYLG